MPKTRSPAREPRDAAAELLDHAGDVPADGERRLAEEAAARPHLPVDRVDAGGGHAHEHLGRAGLGPGDLDELEHLGPAERRLADRSHRRPGHACCIQASVMRRRRRGHGCLHRDDLRVPEPVRDRDPARLRGLGGDVPVLRALRTRRGARSTRTGSGSGTRCTSRCRCRRSTWPASTAPYQALGVWQNRVFAVPPAMGIDYRVVNGYVYISGNPVTDPEKIAERAEFFQQRAGYYFENWDELYGKFKAKMEALIAEITDLHVPDLPEYEPDEVAFEDDRNTSFYEVLDAYDRTLRCRDLMWQHHFEFLLLGYGAYMTFSEFCKSQLPDIPDQHIAQMVAGIDVLLFKPSAELRRLAQLAIDTGVDGAFVEGRTPGGDRRRARRERGGPRLARGARADQGPLVQHGDRRRPLPLLPQLVRRPEHPVRVGRRPRAGAQGRRGGRAADRGARTRARPARGGVRRAARRGRPEGVPGAARALAHRLPVRRGAQVLLRLLVPDALVEQGARVRRAARAARLPRGRARTSSSSVAHEVAQALDELRPHLGHGRRAARTRALAADRRAAQGAAASGSASGRRRRRSARRRRRSPTRP